MNVKCSLSLCGPSSLELQRHGVGGERYMYLRDVCLFLFLETIKKLEPLKKKLGLFKLCMSVFL